ncbi:hypothetical protein [Actinoplanes sp. CA-252034]|uniref:hypothetical protein n=1 Tax=Actinoplanes sp. CA-252034 TaxID=3239906 RepID=UPI003D958F95
MTRMLRGIGYWDGPQAPDGWPDVCAFAVGEPDERVAAYLRSGTPFMAMAGRSRCRLCGRWNGSAELTDGESFCWPEGLAHYVEEHGVRLPEEVRAVAARGPARPVDALLFNETIPIDAGWWRAQARDGAHLPGCRHSASLGWWELPAVADIHVDRVPVGDVALMARLRRALGVDWPFATLRELTARQPVLAVTGGDPAALNRRHPELCGYLFYATADGLLPVATEV